MIPSVGIHYGVEPEEYHSWQAVSASWLKELRKTPAHLADMLKNGGREASRDQDFGSAVHCRVLESDQYAKRFAVRPEGMNGTTKEGKAFKADAEAKNQTVLSCEQGRWVEAIAFRAKTNRRLQEWFGREHKTEVSMVWERDGFLCKARADLFVPGINIMADLKTTVTASPEGFAGQVAKYCYHNQAAWYLDGARRITGQQWDWFFVACEKGRPFMVTCPQLVRESAAHLQAVAENDKLFEIYKGCMQSGNWPGYPDTNEIVLPDWAIGGSSADDTEESFD